MDIRPEIRADHRAVDAVHRLAFGRDDEADLVAALRDSETFVPGLALVALRGGEVVGHIVLSRVDLVVDVEDGGVEPVLALAPLAVHPSWQHQGVGGALVSSSLRRASVRPEPVVIVLGVPAFYRKLGFRPAAELDIRAPFPVVDRAFLARRLPAFRPGLAGEIRYPAVFKSVSGPV